ncbi:MAG: rhomboid family intramembrane serine protease [Proteobacteria bacterium]|nr:rhomboid family intramembrane serine protease [Pseudomonadota bacterium]
MFPMPPVTQALLLINVAAYFLSDLTGPWLVTLFALWPVGAGFLPWQIATYAFLHGSFDHLLFNMLGLWMFGSELEQLWGPRRFIQFFGASVLAAALAQLAVTAYTGSVYPTIGASGGLFGLLLAFGMIFPRRTILLFFVIPVPARILVILYGAFELFQGVYGTSAGVAHFAHLGGMLGGYLTMQYWRGKPPFGRR